MTTIDEKTTICMGEDCPYKKKCNKCNAKDKRNIEPGTSGFHNKEFVEVTDPATGEKRYVSKPFE